MPLRTTLLALSLAVLIYVALIGGVIVFGISPSASRLQGRSTGLLAEYEGSQHRARRLDLARTDIRELLEEARSGPVAPDSLTAIRLGLQATADSARTVERVAMSLGDSPRLRGILTNSIADESRLRGALLGAIAAIELGELAMAERILGDADSVDRSLNRALGAATAVALQNVTLHEGALAETAGNAARLVWIWLAAGLLAVPLVAMFFRRRLYAPLSELDRGMARVAAGDLEVHLTPERDDELGRLRGHFNEMTGVLRQRASEAEQRTADETAARTRLILDAALDAVIVMDMEGRIREWNPQAEVVFGWARAEVLGRCLADTVIPPELRAGHVSGLARYLSTGQASILGRRLEIDAMRRDGSRFPVELAVIPIHHGKQLEFSAFLRDITQRRASAAALTASEERYRAAFEQAAVGMAEVNPEGRFLRVNPAFGNIVGRSVAELTGMT
jgi:PAS domain S-box-containing protein